MATQQEIDSLLSLLSKRRPNEFVKKANTTNRGIGAVIHYLYGKDSKVTAGDISEFLNVSTARVAVILQKMEKKGLITKTKSQQDARVTVVDLTEQGKETAQEMKEQFTQQIGLAIDTVGYERMLEFACVLNELCGILKPPNLKGMD